MILSILWPFIKAEWRYIALFALLAGLYFAIYDHGYHDCKLEVLTAKEEATKKVQAVAEQEKKKLIEDNQKEIERSTKLQEKLDVELKKKQYTNCILSPDGVRILNKAIK